MKDKMHNMNSIIKNHKIKDHVMSLESWSWNRSSIERIPWFSTHMGVYRPRVGFCGNQDEDEVHTKQAQWWGCTHEWVVMTVTWQSIMIVMLLSSPCHCCKCKGMWGRAGQGRVGKWSWWWHDHHDGTIITLSSSPRHCWEGESVWERVGQCAKVGTAVTVSTKVGICVDIHVVAQDDYGKDERDLCVCALDKVMGWGQAGGQSCASRTKHPCILGEWGWECMTASISIISYAIYWLSWYLQPSSILCCTRCWSICACGHQVRQQAECRPCTLGMFLQGTWDPAWAFNAIFGSW